MIDTETIAETGLHCPTCGYNLTAVKVNRCPECGTPFRIEKGTEPPDAGQRRAQRIEIIASVLLGVIALIAIFSWRDSVPPFTGVIAYVILMSALIGAFAWPYLQMSRFVPEAQATSASEGETSPTLPFSFEVEYGPEFSRQYLRRLILPVFRRLIIGVNFAAVLIGALLVVGADSPVIFIAVGGVCMILLFLAQQLHRVTYKQTTTKGVRYVIDENGLSYFTPDGKGVLPWHALKKIEEHPEMWLVYVGETALCLPTHSVSPEVLSTLKLLWQEKGLRRVTPRT